LKPDDRQTPGNAAAIPPSAEASSVTPNSHEVYFPPDIGVPLIDVSQPVDRRKIAELIDRWKTEDARGSADGAYVLGLLLGQVGDVRRGFEALQRADERGSAEAAYLIGVKLAGQHLDTAEEYWRRADTRGSAGAAVILAYLAEQRGELENARALWERAKRRAEAADAAGSADAACLMAWLYLRDGDQTAAESAYERADQRGSGLGAYARSTFLFNRGELHAAEEAAERATNRGLAVAGYAHGVMLSKRGETARAKRAWRLARLTAHQVGDMTTLALTRRALHPPIRQWLRSHVGFDIVTVGGLAALWLFGNWRWAAAAAVLLIALIPLRWSVDVGMPRPNTDGDFSTAGLPAIPAGPFIFFAGVGGNSPEIRLATKRDKIYDRILVLLYVAVLIALALWLLRYFGNETMLRCLYGGIGLVTLWSVVYRAPTAFRRPAPLQDIGPEDRDQGLILGASFFPVPSTGFRFEMFTWDIRIQEPIINMRIRTLSQGPVAQRFRLEFRRITALLTWLGWAVLGAFFLAKAALPKEDALVSVIFSDAGSAVVLGIAIVGIAISVFHAWRLIQNSP
jgi:hypothetical protein